MKKKKKTLRERKEKKLLMEGDFYSDVEDIIKKQSVSPGYEEEEVLNRRMMEKIEDEFVVSLTTVKKLASCMRKYGHIEWIEMALDQRIKSHFGESYSGKSLSGPREPVNGDHKEYAVNVDVNGRRFVRIPVSLLKMERGQKVTAMFHEDEIVIKPKRRVL